MHHRITALIPLVLLTMVSFTSCQKDKVGGGQFKASFERFRHKDTKVTYDGSALSWQGNEEIAVFRTTTENSINEGYYSASGNSGSGNTATLVYTSGTDVTQEGYGSNPYIAYYPSTIATAPTSVTLPETQRLDASGQLVGYPMHTSSNSTDLTFYNLCGMFKLTLPACSATVSHITITSTVPLCGQFNVSYDGSIPIITPANDNNNYSVTLECDSPVNLNTSASRDFYIYLPKGDYTSFRIEIFDNSTAKVATQKLKPGNTFNIERSQISNINLSEVTLNFIPIGAINGLFTIGDNKQIYFSKGNLQYTTRDEHNVISGSGDSKRGTWRFAEHQYDYVGCTTNDIPHGNVYYNSILCQNNNKSRDYSGWIDLFKWATSGWNAKYPWVLSYVDYSPIGSSDITVAANNANYDWGYYNAISNGGNQTGLWRTLTALDWRMIFQNHDYARATVYGTPGIILLPNIWSIDKPSVRGSSSNFNSNTYNGTTTPTWEELEDAGAVFLPITGQITNSNPSTFSIDNDAYYWSATSNSGTQYVESRYIYFNASSLNVYENNHYFNIYRNYGLAVRLVRDK